MNITGLVHVNINCSDYDRSLQFYRMLGFEEIWRVPETNTEEVARAVGMRAYRVKGALLALRGAAPGLVIDLLEWLEPRSDAAPYPTLHQPGIARIALATSDLDADYRHLLEQGVEVLSPPADVKASATSGSRFFCFKDPDGAILELVEHY